MNPRLELDRRAEALITARAFVGSALRVLGAAQCDIVDARLLVTELMTGMIAAEGGRMSVEVDASDGLGASILVGAGGGNVGHGIDELLADAGFAVERSVDGWTFRVGLSERD